MSIWSKNHEELAKLAKTLQDRNVRTRRQLGKDELGTWPSDRLGASRSKSDSNLSSSATFAKNGFHDLSLAGCSEDDSSIRLRMDSFSSGDSAISPDFTRGTVLSPNSILKPHSRVVRNGCELGKSQSLSSSPRNLDKKVTFLLRAGSDDNMEAVKAAGKNIQRTGTGLLNGDRVVNNDIVFTYESDVSDHRKEKSDGGCGVNVKGEDGEVVNTSVLCHTSNGILSDSGCSVHVNGVNEHSDLNMSNRDNVTHGKSLVLQEEKGSGDVNKSHSFDFDSDEENQINKEGVRDLNDACDQICNIYTADYARDERIINGDMQTSSEPLMDQNSVSIVSNGAIEENLTSGSEKLSPIENTNHNGGVNLKSSTTLNISDDLNLLLISLLTNHKKEKILEDVKGDKLSKQHTQNYIGGDDVSPDNNMEVHTELNDGSVESSNQISETESENTESFDGNDDVNSMSISTTTHINSREPPATMGIPETTQPSQTVPSPSIPITFPYITNTIQAVSPLYPTSTTVCHTPSDSSPPIAPSHAIPSIVLSVSSSSNVTLADTPASHAIPSPTSPSSSHDILLPINDSIPPQRTDSAVEGLASQPTTHIPPASRADTIYTSSEIVTTDTPYRGQSELPESIGSISNAPVSNIPEPHPSRVALDVTIVPHSTPPTHAQSAIVTAIIQNPLAQPPVPSIHSYDNQRNLINQNPFHSLSSLSPRPLLLSDANYDVNKSLGNPILSPLATPTHHNHMNMFSPIPMAQVTPSSYAMGIMTTPTLGPHHNNYFFRPLMGVPEPTGYQYQSSHVNGPLGLANGGVMHAHSPVFAPPPYYICNTGDPNISKFVPTWSPVNHANQTQITPSCANNLQQDISHGHTDLSLTTSEGVSTPNASNCENPKQYNSGDASSRPKERTMDISVTQSVDSASNNSCVVTSDDTNELMTPARECTSISPHSCHSFDVSQNSGPCVELNISQNCGPSVETPASVESGIASSSQQVCDTPVKLQSDEENAHLLVNNPDVLSNSSSSVKNYIRSSECESNSGSLITNGHDKTNCARAKENDLLSSEMNQSAVSQNKIHVGHDATLGLDDSCSSNERLKTGPTTSDKPISPVCYHGAFPGTIDIHVHPTINIPGTQTEMTDNHPHSHHRKHRRSRKSDPSPSSTSYTDGSSYLSSSYSDDTSRHRGDRRGDRIVRGSNSKSPSNAEVDYPRMMRKVEKLVHSLQRRDLLQSKISEMPLDRLLHNSLSRKRHEVLALTKSTESSYSHSTKSVVRSNRSVTSTSSKTSIVETVHSDSNALALLQTLKIFQNLSSSDDGNKLRSRNGEKTDRYSQLLEILDHFESQLSSHQLKDVKHDLHDLARNLKRQMKTNRIAVRDEIENRSKLFTSDRFTKGATTDLKIEEVSSTASGSNQTSGNRRVPRSRQNLVKESTQLTASDPKPKGDNSNKMLPKTMSSSNTTSSFTDISSQIQDRLVTQQTQVVECVKNLQPPLLATLSEAQCVIQDVQQQTLTVNKEVDPNHPFLQMVRFLSEESKTSRVGDTSCDGSQNNMHTPMREALPVVSITSMLSSETNRVECGSCVASVNIQRRNNVENSNDHFVNAQTCNENENTTTDKSNGIDPSSVKLAMGNAINSCCVGSNDHANTHRVDTPNPQHTTNSEIDSEHDRDPSVYRNESPLLSNISPTTPQSLPVPAEILVLSPELVSAFTPIHPAPKSQTTACPEEEVPANAVITGSTPSSDVTDLESSTVPREMESDSHHSFQMDREFDKLLADMKPHVLKLPHKADRQKCAVWIKKLCEPQGSSLSARKTRNLYAQLMLQMLKKGAMSSPFDQKPVDGPLHPLPSYVSVYFDDPLNSFNQAERIPDWVEGELGDTMGSSGLPRSLGNPAATSTWVSGIADLTERPHSSMGHTLDKDPSLSPIRHSDKGRTKGYSADDMSIEVKRSPSPPRHRPMKSLRSPDREKRQLPDVKVKGTRDEGSRQQHHQHHHHHQQSQHDYPLTNDTDWNSKPYNMSMASSVSLPKGTTFYDDLPSYHKPTDREVAVRTKMIEAKFHEEKLKLQQKHDTSVQKILDRKNAEIEDVKSHYRSKSKDLEDTNSKLEKKVQTLLKEVEYVTQNKDKQIGEMKKLAEDSNETRRNEFEKRLHDVMTEFEQEKFDMQKQHTQNIQEILDDTNSRLQRMETEYSHQTTTTTNVIKELESRVQQLMTEVDSTLNQRSAVEKEKNEALSRLEKLTDDYERLREKSVQMERQHHVATETQEHNLRSLKNKTEASLEFLKQENAIAASKAADTIKELEEKIEQLKKAVKETEEQRHRQTRELEQVHQQDKLHAENLHDKQVRNIKKEMEQQDSDWGKKLSKAEKAIKEREEEISKLKEQKQQQAMQSEQALEEFKMQVEKNQARIYDEMKQQMEQVEGDLTKSKQAREKQAKEFTRQMEDMGFKHQHEIAEIKMNGEAEKSQLMREFHVQKEFIISEHDKEVDNLKDVHRADVQALEARLKERQDKADKTSLDSERTIRELREELVQANQLRKQQLVELGLLREEEKQKVHRDHEAELARQRTELEQHRLELQKSHSTEMEAVLEKTNDRLKSIEKEYSDRGSKSAESIAELQNVVLQLRGDIKKSRENSDDKLAELKHQYEEEKQNLRKHYSQNLATIQKEVEANRNRARNLERQMQTEESDHEEKITHLQLQYEERIRGLMSSDLKQELESTITSLKSQVSALQQRSLMLQEELDAKNRNSFGPFGSRTSSPIKSSV